MRNLLSVLLFVAILLPVGAGAQQAEYLAGQRIKAAVTRLSDPLTENMRAKETGAIMAGVGLAWKASVVPQSAAQAFVPDEGAVIEVVDLRLLLTQIAIQTGARDHVALVRAQGDREHDVILLRGGFATLDDLIALSQGTPAQDFVTATPVGTMLTRPLAIWSDAGLTLGPADHLILDGESGSFLANLGWLNVAGGWISGNRGSNTAEPAFNPFVLTAGQGSFTSTNATFQSLGFGEAAVFGGLSVANNGLVEPRLASHVTNSTLEDVRTLAMIGTKSTVVTGNRIVASSGPAVLISDARDTLIAANSLTELAGSQAIRVTAGSAGVTIDANSMSGAARTGILIDRDSRGISILDNLVAGSVTSGISVDGATCVTIKGNLIAGNGGTGIDLTGTDETSVLDNAVLHNHGSGVLVRDQTAAARVWVTGNVLMGNRDGLRGATVGDVTIAGNDLNGQMPRVFAGDFALIAVDWLRDRRNPVPAPMSPPASARCVTAGEG